MFGMGFTEILLVAIVAIIALGPEKLPQAMVDIAKFFRAFKKTIDDAKQSIDREIHLSELKQEAISYKSAIEQNLTHVTDQLKLDDVSQESSIENSSMDSKESIGDVLKSLDDMSFIEQDQNKKDQKIEKPSTSITKTPSVLIEKNPQSIGFGGKNHKEKMSV